MNQLYPDEIAACDVVHSDAAPGASRDCEVEVMAEARVLHRSPIKQPNL
jgi:hypothetical protein